jgi:hypothetical protein
LIVKKLPFFRKSSLTGSNVEPTMQIALILAIGPAPAETLWCRIVLGHSNRNVLHCFIAGEANESNFWEDFHAN